MALPTASDNPFPSLLIVEGTEPSSPAAGKQRLYIDSTTHHLMRVPSTGTEVDIEAGGSGIPATILDAKGDLIAASAADTAAKLTAGTNGYVLTADSGEATGLKWAPSSGGTQGTEIGYDQITSPVTVSSATEASGTTVITCAAHTFDGSPVMAHFFSPEVAPGTGDLIVVCLFESTTEIGRIADVRAGSGVAAQQQVVNGWLRFTPSAGSHTYLVKAIRGGANGVVSAGAGGTGAEVPAFIRFTKV